ARDHSNLRRRRGAEAGPRSKPQDHAPLGRIAAAGVAFCCVDRASGAQGAAPDEIGEAFSRLARRVLTRPVMWIVKLALRRPYTFVVMALLIGILGVVTIFRVPVDMFPEINIPVVAVVWNYTGMSADDMEARVVGPC